jgi:hypothetical protein
MTQADSVHSTPPLNTPIDHPKRLIQQQRKRESALRRIAKLRKKASAEIERLLTFLDACDPYVSTELEDDGDQGDASYPEASGSRMCEHPIEDDEDGADDEPWLGGPEFGFYCQQNEPGDRYWPHYTQEGDQTVHQGGTDDREAPDDLEPSLCGVTAGEGTSGMGDDLEGDDTPSGRSAEEEPSLGSVYGPEGARRGARRCKGGQEQWAQGNDDDREGDPGFDDREPNVDDEPSLCGTTVERGDDRDREGDDADREPSLGWTADGRLGNWDDRELAPHTGMPRHKMDQMHKPADKNLCNIDSGELGPVDRRRRGFRVKRTDDKPNTRGLL